MIHRVNGALEESEANLSAEGPNLFYIYTLHRVNGALRETKANLSAEGQSLSKTLHDSQSEWRFEGK